MDPLIYLHLAFTPETPVELPLQPIPIWKKFSSLASLCLYPLIISLALIGFAQRTPAQTDTRAQLFQEGDSGYSIEVIQRRLSELGYFNTNVTGYFGPVTRDALIAFQRERRITPTGQAGPLTLAYLMNPDSNPIPQPIQIQNHSFQPTLSRRLELGSTGTEVVTLQQRLQTLGFYNGPINGFFDLDLQDALIWFQQTRGITPTGQVGQTTAQALSLPITISPSLTPPITTKQFIGLGDSGATVGAYQQRLKQLGFYWGPITSFFDEATRQAVLNFQRATQVQTTGVIGDTTRSQLYSPEADRISNLLQQIPQMFYLRPGDRGPLVSQLQTWLKQFGYDPGTIDGVYGPQTETARRRFEQEVFYPLAQNFQVPAPLSAMPAYNPPATFYSSVETTSQPQTTNLNPQQILTLQQKLQQLSLYSGPLDGTYNLQTRTAVTRAQVKYGISANELLNQP